ncbi:MAG: hypothetical protein WBX27_09510 [Specibacter sp.]
MAEIPKSPVVEPVETVEPDDTTFKMRYGVLAVLVGWLVTHVLYCGALTISIAVSADPTSTESAWNWFPVFLIFGLPVAAVLGLPFALLLAWPLRSVRNQWLHVAAFATAAGAIAMIVVMAQVGWPASISAVGSGLVASMGAAVGRASVIKLVARRNTLMQNTLRGHIIPDQR